MPTYEYQCLMCGKKLDFFQKITDAPLTKCPSCQGQMKRLISSGSGLIFKGSGFYITDYKKKETNVPSKKDDTSPKETTKPQDNKSNAKDQT
jgi:putative FmdB family regulatory protein